MRHYHITQGKEGGYLPDVNYTSKTKRQAADIAHELVNQFRADFVFDKNDNTFCPWSISGNKNEGYYIDHKEQTFYGRLGYIIDINVCFEDDCLVDLLGDL